MIEVMIRKAAYGVSDLEDGEKQLNFYHEASDTYYLIPLDREAVESIAEQLAREPVEQT